MITTVCLDAGGVLVNPNWDRVAEALAQHGVVVEPTRLAAAEPHAKRTLDVAETITSTNDPQRGWLYFNMVFERCGIPRSNATDAALDELRVYHTQSNLWESVPAEVVPALEDLCARGLSIVVISNANGRLHTLLDRVGLSGFFDVVVDSHVEGVEKPDPQLFHLAIARAGSSPDECLHVGDLYQVDVLGARAAGVAPVLLDVADLYRDADCPRIRSLSELKMWLPASAGRPS
jgi:putative hydrolase of the HAD superfamily